MAQIFEESKEDVKMNDKEWEKNIRQIFDECFELMKKKRHDYGRNNIADLGTKGVFVRLYDKINRLKNLVWDNKEAAVENEKTEDTYMDIANYGIISLFLSRYDDW